VNINADTWKSPGPWPTLDGKPTVLMAHRGEKVLLPEHTVGAYEVASIEGADFVEPDLVLTKDGYFVCYHDLTLGKGTDVSMRLEFADRMVEQFNEVIDEGAAPANITNEWFIKDFTLEELKNLTVIQKDAGIRPKIFDNLFKIPTFEEYLEVVHNAALALKRSIGMIF
jgi:glycerophosphoryl diester phosphodiesterase